jgi:hypothetical protein
LPADHDELATCVAYAFAAVPSEVGNGLEVWRQATRQSHELDVALALAFKAPT